MGSTVTKDPGEQLSEKGQPHSASTSSGSSNISKKKKKKKQKKSKKGCGL